MTEERMDSMNFTDLKKIARSNRRKFLKRLGCGVIIVFSLSDFSFLFGEESGEADEVLDFNLYLRVKEDGRVDCFTGKIEMGQGVITSLAQELAEELEVPIDHVDMVMGDTDLCPYDAGTWGSLTTRFFGPLLRVAAAKAREELILLASKRWNVDASQLKAHKGHIINVNNEKKSLGYASLTKGKKIVRTIRKVPSLKDYSDYTVVGKPVVSSDATYKVTGRARYSADIQLPGMMYAYIERPPAHGCNLLDVDTTAAEAIEGVHVVCDGDIVAVLHANPNTAEVAMAKVTSRWSKSENIVNDKTIFKHILLHASSRRTIEDRGDIATGHSRADKTFDMEYLDGYKAHASIETHCATAVFDGEDLTMWVSSQTPFGTRDVVARELDMSKEHVHVKSIFLGGGFGGKVYNQQAVEAAKLARYTGKPINLMWSRREEFMYDRFRPAAVVKINAGVSLSGRITFWEYNVYCAGARGAVDFYGVPNLKSVLYDGDKIHPFGTGPWRAPGNNTNTFARESHIDIMAHGVGMDPLEFRLKNLSDESMFETLSAAARKFGYNNYKPSKGRGCGIALGVDAGTRVAIIAEVEVDIKTGQVQPVRIVCAQDMGQLVNPHGARVQTEGGVTMGLGYALYEDVHFEGREVTTRNFDTYQFTRFSDTPLIETVFLDRMGSPPQGGGEPAIICVGGAIANAIFNACGARVTQMPMTPERILDGL